MECLIRKTETWMDLPENLDRVNNHKRLESYLDVPFKTQYDMRERKGDIIEVQEDGWWSGAKGKGYDKNKFVVVKCVGEDLTGKDEPLHVKKMVPKTIKDFNGNPVQIEVEEFIIVQSRKHNLDISSLSDKAELLRATFNNRLTVKTELSIG